MRNLPLHLTRTNHHHVLYYATAQRINVILKEICWVALLKYIGPVQGASLPQIRSSCSVDKISGSKEVVAFLVFTKNINLILSLFEIVIF